MNPDKNPEIKENVQSVRGMHDFLPEESADLIEIEQAARDVFSQFGYKEIRTPLVESLSLFERALGQTTDIVEKEMFVIKDQGDRLLCLRPEGTAGVVRAFLEHHLDQKMPLVKLFYIGPMFRAERPQAGRFRQFIQMGAEYFGNNSPFADAETINLAFALFEKMGMQSIEIQINNLGCENCRPKYQKELLNFLKKHENELCNDCQRRMIKNPFRALDCKTDGEKLQGAPKSLELLCDSCSAHHQRVVHFLEIMKVPYKIVPTLVRGLDYYTGTVFEIYPSGKTGSQDALAAGGRYDNLVQDLGGPATPAVGFAIGVERVLNFVSQNKPAVNEKAIFLALLGKNAEDIGVSIRQQLLNKDFRVGTAPDRSLKSQMRLADSLGVRFCVIIGDNEINENVMMLKDMKNKSQKKVPINELILTLEKEMGQQS